MTEGTDATEPAILRRCPCNRQKNNFWELNRSKESLWVCTGNLKQCVNHGYDKQNACTFRPSNRACTSLLSDLLNNIATTQSKIETFTWSQAEGIQLNSILHIQCDLPTTYCIPKRLVMNNI